MKSTVQVVVKSNPDKVTADPLSKSANKYASIEDDVRSNGSSSLGSGSDDEETGETEGDNSFIEENNNSSRQYNNGKSSKKSGRSSKKSLAGNSSKFGKKQNDIREKIIKEVLDEVMPDLGAYDIDGMSMQVTRHKSKLTQLCQFLGCITLDLHDAILTG